MFSYEFYSQPNYIFIVRATTHPPPPHPIPFQLGDLYRDTFLSQGKLILTLAEELFINTLSVY